MPRRKNKTMKGGFWDTISDMFKKKPAAPIGSTTTTSSYTPSTTSSSVIPSSTTTSTTPSMSTTSVVPSSTLATSSGGRGRGRGRGRRTRRYGGGYAPNHSLTNLASKAAPFSGSKTAQPQVWLGGPKMMGGKSRKLRKSKKSKRKYRK